MFLPQDATKKTLGETWWLSSSFKYPKASRAGRDAMRTRAGQPGKADLSLNN